MQQPNYIVFQCYGQESVFLECTFALLSLSRLYGKDGLSGTEIWIYTDNPDWFSTFKDCNLPLNFRRVDADTIRAWRGTIDFVHRVKIEVLLDFTSKHTGNILYADTDVVFTHQLEPAWAAIERGTLFMHIREGKVSDKPNPLLTKLDRYLRSKPAGNEPPLYDLDMWNAGVLGFNASQRPLLEKVLQFTDTEFPQFPKHIIEQFAFSIQFQQTGHLQPAFPYTLHYWSMKELRVVLKSFFDYYKGCTWHQLADYSGNIQLYEFALAKTRFLYNRTIWEKLNKKPWDPNIYDWAALTK